MRKGEVIAFLDILRGPAALMVVWVHWMAQFPEKHGFTPVPTQIVRTWITEPLGIIQDFGWLGVCLFFLISGFIITHVAQRESRREFLIKRVFRIYPLLTLAVLLALLFSPSLRSLASLKTIALNVSLLNYFFYPQIIFVKVAWTLVIEVLFYVLMLGLYALRRRPEHLVSLELFFVLAVITLAHSWGTSFFLLAAAVAYLPYLIVGQLFYFGLYAKKLQLISFSVLLIAALGITLYGLQKIHTQFLPVENSYISSFGWAVVIFLLGLLFNSRLSAPSLFKYLAYMSYTIYLLHGIVGDAALHYFFPIVGYTRALILTSFITGGAVFLVYHFYEKPILRFGHKIAGGQR